MTVESARTRIAEIASMRVYDLGRELSPIVPHHPSHAPFRYELDKAHGDAVDAHGMSAANDVITTGTHAGTHIDGLAHISVDGYLPGGAEASQVQDREHGFSAGYGIEAVDPIVVPAVVVDVPRVLGLPAFDTNHLITADELERTLAAQGAEIAAGGALLIRTGWGRDWPDATYPTNSSPGPGVEAALWAWDRGARIFGSDTPAFEQTTGHGLPVHRELLARRGAHIVEMMYLEEVCDDEVWEFVLVLAPLKLKGATGSPLRPVGLAPSA